MRAEFKTAFVGLAVVSAAGLSAAQPDRPLAIAPDASSLQWGACPPVFPGDCRIAVLHGDPAKPNADVLLKTAPGYVLPRHRHSSAERMMLAGGEMRVKYDGADEAILRPGTYAYGPAGLPHEARCVSRTPCLLFIAFEGPVDAEPVTEPAR